MEEEKEGEKHEIKGETEMVIKGRRAREEEKEVEEHEVEREKGRGENKRNKR